MKKYHRIILLLCFLILGFAGVNSAWCQPPPSDCTPGNPDFDEENCIPLDGGLAFLLIAGAGYGIRRYRSSHRNNLGNASNGL